MKKPVVKKPVVKKKSTKLVHFPPTYPVETFLPIPSLDDVLTKKIFPTKGMAFLPPGTHVCQRCQGTRLQYATPPAVKGCDACVGSGLDNQAGKS